MHPIHGLLQNLRPYDFPGSERIRLGPEYDGGYVLLDESLKDVEVVYSYGVETNSDFELRFCESYNAIARLYDHTVEEAPLKRDFFYFNKEGVGPEKTSNCNTIGSHIKENGDDGKQLLLKMDVEGAEWDALLQTPDSVLKLFNQIAIEVHGLGTELSRVQIYKKIKVFQKINNLFYLFHVHANNYSPLHYIDGFKVPDVMELTFINKKYFNHAEYSSTIFPTEVDQPNNSNREDTKLYFWPFYPGTIPHIKNIAQQKGFPGWVEILSVLSGNLERVIKSMLIRFGLRRATSHS